MLGRRAEKKRGNARGGRTLLRSCGVPFRVPALLRRFPLLALAAVTAAVGLLVLAVALLTGTQVGRDAVARQIEREFDRRFAGSLEIGRLSGNLLLHLHGRDLVVRDPQGVPVIRADSLVLRPRWRALLANRLEFRRLTLVRPQLELAWDAEGRLGLAEAFRATGPPRAPREGAGLALEVAEIRLVDGTLRSRRDGAPPPAVRDGVLFDYTNVRLTGLDARLRLDVTGTERRVHVARLSGTLPELGVTVRRATARLALTGETLRAEGLALELDRSRLAGRLVRANAGGDLELTLRPSRLDPGDLGRLVPAWPLAAPLRVELEAAGRPDALDLRRLRLAHGTSQLATRGTVGIRGDTLRFALGLDDLAVQEADLADLLPRAAALGRRVGSLRGRADAAGLLTWTTGLRVQTDAQLDLTSGSGALRGQLRLATAPGEPTRLALEARVAQLDPGRLLDEPGAQGRLTGLVALDLADTARPRGRLRLDLAAGTLADRAFERLTTDLAVNGLRLEGAAAVTTRGALALEGTADLEGGTYALRFRADSLDARALWPEAPTTSLSAGGTLQATGHDLDDLAADLALAFSRSSVLLADTSWTLPEDSLRLALRPAGTDAPRLRLDTDALDLRVEGPFRWEAVVPLAVAWGERLGEALRAEADKPSRGPRPARRPLATLPPGWAPQDVRLTARARRPGAFRPLLAYAAPGTEAHLTLTLGSDTLALHARARGSARHAGGLALAALDADVLARANAHDDPLASLVLAVSAHADTLALPAGLARPAFTLRPRVDARFHPEARSLTVQASALRLTDSVAVRTELDVALLPTRNRLVADLALDAPDQSWRVERAAADLFADALVVDALVARRTRGPNGPGPEPRLSLRGTASARPDDRLEIVAEAVDLSEALRLAGIVLPLDGLGTADLLVWSALGQPAVVGTATIEDFAVFGTVAGRLSAQSEIVPGRDGVLVDLRLRPQHPDDPVRNHAQLTGSLRLPGRRPDGTPDPGFFDLHARLERLDLFFLDGLFPDLIAGTTGGGTGALSIRGDWRFPLFEGHLDVADARTRVPAFNLGLGAAGRVEVDREGIHFRNVRVADKAGGSGFVRGTVGFNEYRFFSFDLAADLAEFEVIDVGRQQAGTLPFYGRIRASGSATLKGPIHDAFLRSTDAQTTPDSELFIPIVASGPAADAGFLVFADAEGRIPEPEVRQNLIARRPAGEREFLAGLQMNLNVLAPPGSTVHLVFDPLVGDVISAQGSGRIQLALVEDEFQTFGTFEVERGSYLFTAGDVFTRRFELERGGTIAWDGDPIDARLDLPASYRTRASLAGLGLPGVDERQRVPFVVGLQVGGRVTAPLVELSLALDETAGRALPAAEALRRHLNESDRQAEFATSVLLTNTFLLAPSTGAAGLAQATDDLLFTSLSELVSARLSLFLNQALGADNLDVAVGVQQGASTQDVDLTYGVALRLLDERLVIRGEGLYQQLEARPVAEGLQGEVAVELRLTDGVALEVFFRREGELFLGSGLATAPTGTYGAGLSYQTDFPNWRWLVRRLLGIPPEPRRVPDVAAAGGRSGD